MFSNNLKVKAYLVRNLAKRGNVTGNLIPKLRIKKEYINQHSFRIKLTLTENFLPCILQNEKKQKQKYFMKTKIKSFPKLLLFLTLIVLSSCEADKILLENQESTIAKKVSLKNLNPKTNSNLFKAVKNFNDLKSNQSTSKIVYNEVSKLYIDDEKGLFVKDGEKQSYTFPVIKFNQSDKVENVCFNLNNNGSYDVYLVKYQFNKEQFNNLNQQQLEQSQTHIAPLIINDIPLTTLSYVCIDVVAWVSYEMAPIDEGELTGNNGYEGGGGAWVTIASNCFFVNSGSSGSGANNDGFGYTNGNLNTGEGGTGGDSTNGIITGSVIDDIDPNNPPSNVPVGFLIDFYANNLESDELATFKLHPEFYSYLFNNNCSPSSQNFISSLIYGLQNNSYNSEEITALIELANNNNLKIKFDDTLNNSNALSVNNVSEFQNFLNSNQNGVGNDFQILQLGDTKISSAKIEYPTYSVKIDIKQQFTPTYDVISVNSYKTGITYLLTYEQKDFTKIKTGSNEKIDVYGTITYGVKIGSWDGLSITVDVHYEIIINRANGEIISAQQVP